MHLLWHATGGPCDIQRPWKGPITFFLAFSLETSTDLTIRRQWGCVLLFDRQVSGDLLTGFFIRCGRFKQPRIQIMSFTSLLFGAKKLQYCTPVNVSCYFLEYFRRSFVQTWLKRKNRKKGLNCSGNTTLFTRNLLMYSSVLPSPHQIAKTDPPSLYVYLLRCIYMIYCHGDNTT